MEAKEGGFLPESLMKFDCLIVQNVYPYRCHGNNNFRIVFSINVDLMVT
jgi:hypothetical protein